MASERTASKGSLGIQSRLIVLLLVMLIPIMTIQAFIYYDRYQTRRVEELNANLEVARAMGRAFDAFIQDVLHHELAIGIAATGPSPLTYEALTRLLEKSAREVPAVRDFFWFSPQGRVLACSTSKAVGMDGSDRTWFKELTSGREWVVNDLDRSKLTGEPTFAICRAIRDDEGVLLGLVVAAIVPERLDSVFALHRPGDAGVSLLDSKGMHVYRYPTTKYTWEQRNWLKLYPAVGEALKGKDVAATVTSDLTGIKRLVGFTPVASIGWVSAASRAIDEAMEPVTSALLWHAGSFLCATLASFLLALWISRTIAAPIERIHSHALSLGRGNWDERIDVSGPKEAETLAEAMNWMAMERKRAEEELHQARRWFRTTLSSIGDAVIATDASGLVTFLNPIGEKLTGWDSEEALGEPIQHVFNIINEKTRAPAEDIVERVLKEGMVVNLANNTALITRDGGEIPIEDSAAPIKDEAGNIIGVVLVFHDVTEKRRVQDALRLNEERLRIAKEAAGLGIHDYDVASGNIQWDERVRELWGVGADDPITYELFMSGLHPDDRLRTQSAVDRALVPGGDGEYHAEYRVLALDDETERWVAATGKVFFEEERPVRLVGTVQDITERKRAEKTLRESEERYRILAAASFEGILLTENGRLIDANEQFSAISGYEPEEMIGLEISSMIPLEDFPRVIQNIESGVNSAIEHDLIRKDGSLRSVEAHGRTLEHKGRRLRLTVIRDITERKLADQVLRETEERLRLALDAAGFGAFDYHPQSGKLLWDETLKHIWSIKADEDLTLSCMLEGVHPEDRVRVTEIFEQAISPEGDGSYLAEYRIVWPDESIHWNKAIGRVHFTGEGEKREAARVVGIEQDITERKQAEESLRKSEERFRLALRNAPVSVAAQDLDLRYIWAYNQRTAPLEGIVGNLDSEIFTHEEAEMLTAIKRRVIEENIEIREQMWLDRPSGRIFLDVSFAPIHDEAGQVTGVGIATVDLTPIKLADVAFRESEDRLQMALSAAQAGVWSWNIQTGEIVWSPENYSLYGLDSDHGLPVYSDWEQCVHPDDLGPTNQAIRDAVERRTPEYHSEFRVIHPKLGVRWILGVGRVEFAPDGTPFRMFGINLDITERKQAELALNESEEKYRRLFHSSPDSVILASFEEGHYLEVNDSFCRLIGYTKEEIVGKTALELGIWADLEQRMAIRDILSRTGRISDFPCRLRAKPGDIKDVLLSVENIEVHGQVCMLSVVQDVTERKRAEEALSIAKETLESTLGSITDGYYALDSEWRFVAANPVAEKHFGRSASQLLGQNIWEMTEIPRDAVVYQQFHEAVSKQLPVHFEAQSRLRSGFWAEMHLYPRDGHLDVYFSDISERKRMEEELQRSEAVYRSIATNFPGGAVYVFDRNLQFLVADGTALDAIGWNRTKLEGLSVRDLDEETREIIEPRYRQVLSGETLRFETDYRGRALLSDYVPIRDESGEVIMGLVVSTDISERKQMEEELRKSRDELDLRVQERTAELQVSNKALMEYAAKLERLNEELQDFAFVAAHDLQEPLRKIQTFCDMAIKRCEPALDNTGKEYLDKVVKSASRMRELLHDLLQFSRVAEKPGPFKEVDLGKIVGEAAELFEEDLSRSGGVIEVEEIPAIEADEPQMMRLFQNLMGNALKYRREEAPQIKIYAKRNGERCEIIVEDNGIGFDQQYAERIFKPFQRLHRGNEYQGAGMGLAICRKIVEWHGGSIRAESEPGKGSRFIVVLPVKHNRREGIE